MNREEILKNAKPILFNTEMVQAILEGRKTVTRRILKGFIPEAAKFGYTAFTPENSISCRGIFGEIGHESEQYGEKFIKLPYKVGDTLYVRETWGKDKYDQYHYRADYPEHDCEPYPIWRPSIHMPKEAARIFLKVTSVRVEKLQNINCPEAEKEGCTFLKEKNSKGEFLTERGVFKELWDSTIKKQDLDKYGWEANPWVWVVEFERISREEANENI